MHPFYPQENEFVELHRKGAWVQGNIFQRNGELFEVEVQDTLKECTRFDFRVKKRDGLQDEITEVLTTTFSTCKYEKMAEVTAVVEICAEYTQMMPYEYWVDHLELYEVVFQTLKEDDEDLVCLATAFRMNKHFPYPKPFLQQLWQKAAGPDHTSGKATRLEFHLYCHYIFSYHDGLENVDNCASSRTDFSSLLDDIPVVENTEQRACELESVLSLGEDQTEDHPGVGLKMPTLGSDLMFMQTDSMVSDRTDKNNLSDEEDIDYLLPTDFGCDKRQSNLLQAENLDIG